MTRLRHPPSLELRQTRTPARQAKGQKKQDKQHTNKAACLYRTAVFHKRNTNRILSQSNLVEESAELASHSASTNYSRFTND